jgi:hypothetical protein
LLEYDCGAIAAFGVAVILSLTVSLISTDTVFADGYKKSQVVSEVNECRNYWFPVNIICSNFNSQTQGNENDVAMAAAATTTTTTTPDPNYGAPFP